MSKLHDLTKDSSVVAQVRTAINKKLVGQGEIVDAFTNLLELAHSGLSPKGRPIGSGLILGPTGQGKTFAAECLGSALYSVPLPGGILRIDCAEFQHGHEIARLVGSPPGYLGHRETNPFFTNKKLADLSAQAIDWPFAIVVFDEIEKSSDTLWNLLLGILDKATLTLGTNEVVNFEKTVILMTSNIGASEMQSMISGKLGFNGSVAATNDDIKRIGISAAKRKFSPEFIGRLDIIAAASVLTEVQMAEVLDREVEELAREIFWMGDKGIRFSVTSAARKALLAIGYDPKSGARNMKRAIDKHVRHALARAINNRVTKNNVDEQLIVSHDGITFTYTVEEA